MIVLYWLDCSVADEPVARHAAFPGDQLTEALHMAEKLRRQRRDGAAISHVSIQSENTQAVGQAGVAEPGADYAHYKRRPDPSIPLGRPSGAKPADEG